MIRCDNLLREYLDWTNKDGADLTEAARWLRLHTDSKDTARRIWPDFSKGVEDYFRSDDVNESLQDEFYADERAEAGDRRPSRSVLNEVYSTEAPELNEAFKAGNRARKKESSQENVADISDMKLDGLRFCQRIYSYAVNELGIDALLITDYSRLQALRGLVNYSEEEYPIVVLSRSSNDEYNFTDAQYDEMLTPDEFITISATDEYFVAELVLNSTDPVDGPDDVPNPGKYNMRGQAEWMEFWNFKPWKDEFEEYGVPAGMSPALTSGDNQSGLRIWKLNVNNLMKMMNALRKYAEDGAGATDIPGFTM